jgi:hypothetical protein
MRLFVRVRQAADVVCLSAHVRYEKNAKVYSVTPRSELFYIPSLSLAHLSTLSSCRSACTTPSCPPTPPASPTSDEAHVVSSRVTGRDRNEHTHSHTPLPRWGCDSHTSSCWSSDVSGQPELINSRLSRPTTAPLIPASAPTTLRNAHQGTGRVRTTPRTPP